MSNHRATDDDRVTEQVRRWARDLIDLSRRNRSIFYRPLKRGTLEIASPSPTVLFASLMADGQHPLFIPPPPEDEEEWTLGGLLGRARSGDVVSNRTTAKEVLGCLKTLHRSATQDLMDRGVQTLYACFGMLEWLEAEGTKPVRSPLVFVPVVLEREAASDDYTLRRSDEDVVLNPSLAVLLDEQFGISLRPDHLDVQDTEVLDEILDFVRAQVDGRANWRVDGAALVTRATFHKEAMYRDLLDNIDSISSHEIIRSLAGDDAEDGSVSGASIPSEAEIDAAAPPEEADLILDADASQRCAIEAARRGASFVMDGPPGTGKSQTIANMIAQLLSDGRSVLFVSEKAAALEVVADRLAAHGLQDYLLELHSHKASRKEVVKQLYEALTTRPQANPRLDKPQRDRARRLRLALTDYADAVNEQRMPLGRSVAWVAGRLAQLAELPKMTTPASVDKTLTSDRVVDLVERFDALARVWAPVEDEDFAWAGFAATDLSATQEATLRRELDEFMRTVEALDELGGELAFLLGLSTPATPDDCRALVAVAHHARRQPQTERHWWGAPVDAIDERVRHLQSMAEAQRVDVAHLEGLYGEGWSDLPADGHVELVELRTRAGALTPAIELPASPSEAGLAAVDAALKDVAAQLLAARDDAAHVERALGVPERARSLRELGDLAAVARRADEVVRPEPAWATPAILRQVQAAVALLEPAVTEYQQRHERVGRVFTDQVFDLDLVTIQSRIEQASGFAKLGKVYRAARKELAGAARSGKATTDVLDALPDAIEAQRARQQLDALEVQHGALLGRHYQQRSTDTTAVEHAIELLTFAIDRLGDDYDPEAIATHLAGDAPHDHLLGQRAASLDERCQHIRDVASRVVPGGPDLAGRTLDEVVHWIVETQKVLDQLRLLVAVADQRRGQPAALDVLEANLSRRATIAGRQAAVEAASRDDAELIGSAYAGMETRWAMVLDGLAWVSELHRLLGSPAPTGTIERLYDHADDAPSPQELLQHLEQYDKHCEALLARFDDTAGAQLERVLGESLNAIGEHLGLLQDRLQDARTWVDYRRITGELEADGWHATLEDCRAAQVGADRLPETLEQAMYAAWFDDVVAADDRLNRLRSRDRDALVRDYRELDRALLVDASERVVAACNEGRPRSSIGAANLIQREANKKRRHMPVRHLLASAVEVATALKPCFMMSPLSVSQFLPTAHQFDVVIFDEASQIRPADAINCIYRGKQLVVAGDDRQLPPTSFFDADVGDDDDSYDKEAFDEFESVLGLCKGTEIMHSLPLRWHYRSHHESLITFSNYQFYEGQLVTYPGAIDNDPALGVALYQVDGEYRRGGRRDNPEEARFIAQRVLHHAREHRDLSLGVVALSKAQAETIDDAVDRLRREHPEIEHYFEESRLDGFFVKNLENVQGDERDIILFSVGYGPDEVGKFTMNFGPINREGGWRRLNVAVTRARRRVELVTSFSASDMTTGDSRSRGLATLQRYVDYAEHGIAALAVDLSQSEGDVESPLEESILSVLRSWGYDVVPQLGAAGYRIDLAIRDPEHPGRFMLAVEADGAAYHSSRAARDRDRLRQQVLEGLGWRLHRIWGPSWYRDRGEELVRLREAIDRAADPEPAFQEESERSSSVRLRDAEEVSLDATPDWASRYKVTVLRGRATGRSHDPANTTALREAVRAVAATESPVHLEVIGRRVADHWGHNLTRTARREVESAVRHLQRQGELTLSGDFVWVGEDFDIRVPGKNDASRRAIQHIPPEETQEVVHRLLQDARVCSTEELLQGVKDLFGFRRMGPNIAEALETALQELVHGGWIERGDDGRVRTVEA